MDEASLRIMTARLAPRLEGGFVSRVHQMTPYHLLLRIRGGGRAGEQRLLIAIAARGQSLHPTSRRYLNPPRPLRFCAYLRHHFQGVRITGLEKLPHERLVILRGRRREGEEKQLVIELTGKSANAALCSGPEMVIGARMLDLPGAGRLLPNTAWQPPAAGPGAAPRPLTLETATGSPAPEQLADEELFALYDRWFYAGYQEAYGGREIKNLVKALKQQLKRRIRREKKLAAEARDKQAHLHDARLADLFKARLHEIKRGDTAVKVVDYWSSDLKEIEIPLEPSLSPRANLEKLYKNAKKARRGIEMIAARRAATEREIEYLGEIVFQLEELKERLKLEQEVGDEGQELLELAASLTNRQGSRPAPGQKKKIRPLPAHTPARTRGVEKVSGIEGGIIYLGRNALGNENIYRRLGAPDDLWFHVKGRPGAHVLLKTAPGKVESQKEINQAARLAALNSSARNEASATVTMSRLKHLKKPKGARPGQVLISGPVTTITVSLAQPAD